MFDQEQRLAEIISTVGDQDTDELVWTLADAFGKPEHIVLLELMRLRGRLVVLGLIDERATELFGPANLLFQPPVRQKPQA